MSPETPASGYDCDCSEGRGPDCSCQGRSRIRALEADIDRKNKLLLEAPIKESEWKMISDENERLEAALREKESEIAVLHTGGDIIAAFGDQLLARAEKAKVELANTRHRWVEADGERATLKIRAEKAEAERDALKDLPFRIADLQDELNARNIRVAELEIERCPQCDHTARERRGGGRECGGPSQTGGTGTVLEDPTAANPAARIESCCGTFDLTAYPEHYEWLHKQAYSSRTHERDCGD